MAFFIPKDSPITAVQQTGTLDAPGVENGPGQFPQKFFRQKPEDEKTVEIATGDYVVVGKDGEKFLIKQDAFEFLFKGI